jgi:hypothetical protein
MIRERTADGMTLNDLRLTTGLADQPKIVALRKYDANLQRINAEFQILVA